MVEIIKRKGRTILNFEIENMKKKIIDIFQGVSIAILKLEKAMENNDSNIAKEIVVEDEYINNKCLELEKHAYKVIALQQPISSDLRQIVSIIRTVPDLERMGDHIKAIAKILPDIEKLKIDDIKSLIIKMLKIIERRLNETIETFVNKNSIGAIEMSKKDSDIYKQSNILIHKIVNEMKDDINNVSKLLLVAKSIERMGDYIVNICENTVFSDTGKLTELM